MTALLEKLPLLGLDGIVLKNGAHGDRREGARAAARDAAWAAAWAAARQKLAPTVELLQLSALDLLRRMADIKE